MRVNEHPFTAEKKTEFVADFDNTRDIDLVGQNGVLCFDELQGIRPNFFSAGYRGEPRNRLLTWHRSFRCMDRRLPARRIHYHREPFAPRFTSLRSQEVSLLSWT